MSTREYFVHPLALAESNSIGEGTRIWPFAHVAGDAVIGDDCNICEHVFVESGALIGNRVTLKCGVYVWDGVVLKDDVFVGPNVVFTNDRHPRSRRPPGKYESTVVEEFASLGAAAALRCGIIIGRCALVAMGAVVLLDVKPYTMVAGAPAEFKHYVCKCGAGLAFDEERNACCSCGNEYAVTDDEVSVIKEA